MATVALQQVGSKFARENAKRTLEKPIALKFLKKYLSPPLFSSLEKSCEGGGVYIWGSKYERIHQTYKMLGRDSLVLFRRGSFIFKYGVVFEKIENDETLADYLWGRDSEGESWPTIFFFVRISDKRLSAAKVNSLLGRSPKDNWQGLVVLPMKESKIVDEFFKKQLEGR